MRRTDAAGWNNSPGLSSENHEETGRRPPPRRDARFRRLAGTRKAGRDRRRRCRLRTSNSSLRSTTAAARFTTSSAARTRKSRLPADRRMATRSQRFEGRVPESGRRARSARSRRFRREPAVFVCRLGQVAGQRRLRRHPRPDERRRQLPRLRHVGRRPPRRCATSSISGPRMP